MYGGEGASAFWRWACVDIVPCPTGFLMHIRACEWGCGCVTLCLRLAVRSYLRDPSEAPATPSGPQPGSTGFYMYDTRLILYTAVYTALSCVVGTA